MTTDSISGVIHTNASEALDALIGRPPRMALAALLLGLLAGFTGCQTDKSVAPDKSSAQIAAEKDAQELRIQEGDVLKISFAEASNLDSTQQVRRDGKITMPVVGEVKAIGLTPPELEKELIKLYSTQLLSKEVTVTVVSSSFSVFVTGAVMHPGKIVSDRPISALEAIMEAGGFDPGKADMKAVVVIRKVEEGRTKNYTLNLKLVLDGKQSEPFFLRPLDIIVVPERFSWF